MSDQVDNPYLHTIFVVKGMSKPNHYLIQYAISKEGFVNNIDTLFCHLRLDM